MASTASTKPPATAPYANLYHARRVAETASKACYICYKPTTIVLVTPDQKDFFYTCQSHLNDRGFATPKISQEELDRKRKEEELEKEKEKVLKEYEEKQARKKAKEKDKTKDETDKDKGKGKNDKKVDKGKDKAVEKEGAEESKDTADKKTAEPKKDLEYRIYSLHKDIYKMRLQRTIQLENQRKIQQLLRSPGAFPEAPRGFG